MDKKKASASHAVRADSIILKKSSVPEHNRAISYSLEKDVFDIEELEMNTCSSQDCTGLIPSAPTDVDAIEGYEDIYPQLNDNGF